MWEKVLSNDFSTELTKKNDINNRDSAPLSLHFSTLTSGKLYQHKHIHLIRRSYFT